MSKVDLQTNEAQLKKVRDLVLNDETTKKYALFGKNNKALKYAHLLKVSHKVMLSLDSATQ